MAVRGVIEAAHVKGNIVPNYAHILLLGSQQQSTKLLHLWTRHLPLQTQFLLRDFVLLKSALLDALALRQAQQHLM